MKKKRTTSPARSRDKKKQSAAPYNENDVIIFRDRTYLNKKSVSERLLVTARTLHNWVVKGILQPVHVGGRVYFRESDLEKMLKKKSNS